MLGFLKRRKKIYRVFGGMPATEEDLIRSSYYNLEVIAKDLDLCLRGHVDMCETTKKMIYDTMYLLGKVLGEE